VLHRKETLLAEDHPRFRTFERLTESEDRHGLLVDTSRIGSREAWEQVLASKGLTCRGHRLVRVG
jgi:hypothetical protein